MYRTKPGTIPKDGTVQEQLSRHSETIATSSKSMDLGELPNETGDFYVDLHQHQQSSPTPRGYQLHPNIPLQNNNQARRISEILNNNLALISTQVQSIVQFRTTRTAQRVMMWSTQTAIPLPLLLLRRAQQIPRFLGIVALPGNRSITNLNLENGSNDHE